MSVNGRFEDSTSVSDSLAFFAKLSGVDSRLLRPASQLNHGKARVDVGPDQLTRIVEFKEIEAKIYTRPLAKLPTEALEFSLSNVNVFYRPGLAEMGIPLVPQFIRPEVIGLLLGSTVSLAVLSYVWAAFSFIVAAAILGPLLAGIIGIAALIGLARKVK